MDIYSTHYLNGVIQKLSPNPTFFLDRYFPSVLTHDTEEVLIDKTEDRPRITPYVHPLQEGKLVESLGFATRSIRPAYVKDKRVHHPLRAVKRRAGEAIGGSMSNSERMRLNLISDLSDQLNMLTRRLEVMALEVALNGKLQIKGDGIDHEVDFGRDASLTEALTGADAWNKDSSDPIEQLETWAGQIFDKSTSGANVSEVVMDQKAWALFRKSQKVLELLDRRRGDSSTLQLSPKEIADGISFKGFLGDYPIYVYKGSYIDSLSGDAQSYMPDNTVLMMSRALNGVRHFGAIMDENAGLMAKTYHSKSWKVEDPSSRVLLLQAAPLLVPYDVNASMRIKVA